MSKLLPSEHELDHWRTLMEVRVSAAGLSEDTYAKAARRAHRKHVAWVASDDTAEGSFLWACDLLDLDAGAVRRTLRRP